MVTRSSRRGGCTVAARNGIAASGSAMLADVLDHQVAALSNLATV